MWPTVGGLDNGLHFDVPPSVGNRILSPFLQLAAPLQSLGACIPFDLSNGGVLTLECDAGIGCSSRNMTFMTKATGDWTIRLMRAAEAKAIRHQAHPGADLEKQASRVSQLSVSLAVEGPYGGTVSPCFPWKLLTQTGAHVSCLLVFLGLHGARGVPSCAPLRWR